MTFLLASLIAAAAFAGAAKAPAPAAERLRQIEQEAGPLLDELEAAAEGMRAVQAKYETAVDRGDLAAARGRAYQRLLRAFDRLGLLHEELRAVNKRFFFESAAEQLAGRGSARGAGLTETARLSVAIADLDNKIMATRREINIFWHDDEWLYVEGCKAVRARRWARLLPRIAVIAAALGGMLIYWRRKKHDP